MIRKPQRHTSHREHLRTERVVEYLCTNPECGCESPWHVFETDTFKLEDPGEYTVTLRVRVARPAKR